MQHVPSKWLNRYNLVLVGLDGLLFFFYWYFQYSDASQATLDQWGITPVILVIAALHASYSLLIYPLVSKKNDWMAFAIAMMIFGTLWAGIIETSGNTNLWYRAGFAIYVFFLSMVGPWLAVAAATLAWILLVFTVIGITPASKATNLQNAAVDVVVTVCVIAGWLFFRRYYVKKRDQETIALAHLLEQEQVKSSVVLEAITDGVVVVNVKGTIQIINAAAANMFGWSKKEAQNINYQSLYKIVDNSGQPLSTDQTSNVIDVITQALQTGEPHQAISLLATRNNKQFYADLMASPIKGPVAPNDPTGQPALVGVIVVFRDVDKQKREEQQRTEFISTASHEMRTPVAAIEGYLALAMNDKVCLIDEKARGYLDKAHASTQHLGQLFQDLLTSAKADDGRLASHPEVVEFGTYLEKIVDDLRFAAEKKGLALEYVMGTDQENIPTHTRTTKLIKPLYFVEVDPDRVREVITNLFDNAVKYTPSGKITIGLTGNTDVVQFYIKDTGGGIAPEDVPHLFQKFYRIDNTATRTIGGTGLGLFICRKIVELYKGRIWVKSQLNQGSTFFVNFPRLDNAQAEAAKARLARTTLPTEAANPKPLPTVVQ
jgi:signal transduction histidine kinase